MSTIESVKSLTKYMTPKQIQGVIDRTVVRVNDLKRQKELVSRLYREAHGEDARDLERVVCMLDNELVNARESIRVLHVEIRERLAAGRRSRAVKFK